MKEHNDNHKGGNPLWTKNFTIITLGTAVSLIGHALSGFATGLLILDFTGSTFLFAIYLILYDAPRIFVPSLVGPLLDKFSRRRAIYLLDFASSGIYVIFSLFLFRGGEISFAPLVIGSSLLGAINSAYQVAYDSFYPMLITEGNMGKAYSISSTMESLIMVLTPVSVFLYHKIGIAPLFLINALGYFVAAVCETQIKAHESYVIKKEDEFKGKQYLETFKEGIKYLKVERGLLFIAMYFMFSAFSSGAHIVAGLPYFRDTYGVRGEYIFIFVEGCHIVGRVAAGAFHYRHKLKPEHKFTIAFCVYCYIAIAGGTYLFFPVAVMMIINFLMGVAGMTSYNIRISATQNYIPHEKKGRFNGIFQMMSTLGMMSGEFLAGGLADRMDKRFVILAFGMVELAAAWLFMYRGRAHVSKIYNRET